MSDEVVVKILRAYGVTPLRLLGMQKGYRNESHAAALADGQTVNLMLYKTEPGMRERIKRANRVANYAAAQGLPARAVYDRRILQLRAAEPTKYAALYQYLPGHTIPWEAYTMEHIKLLGKAMSDTHHALSTAPQQADNAAAIEYLRIIEQMHAYWDDPAVQQAMRRKLGVSANRMSLRHLKTVVRVAGTLPGQQTLHMDFVRGNILFEGTGAALHVSGILDFEKTAWGHPLFDVARTLAFLLVDCKYKPEHKIRKYFLQSGYNKRGAQQIKDSTIYNALKDDISILECLLNLFLLYDFYKFLRHNPYESLCQNEHYERTKQILINRNIIRAV